MYNFPEWNREKWIDCPDNPIVGFWGEGQPRAAIGDPQVLVPGQFDEKWHMFYHGFYDGEFVPFFHHIVSDDGYKWEMYDKTRLDTNPLFMFHDADKWILYYSVVVSRDKALYEKYKVGNMIRARYSEDLVNWSNDIDILVPELDWEMEHDPNQKNLFEARNPCMVKLPNGRYRLYYSAGVVKLNDCGYEEPKYISFAESDSPFGPFEKYGKPIISPDKNIPYRNLGAGAIKVYGFEDKFLALYNSIYVDENNASRSAINLLMSEDGIEWEEAPYNPIILPTDKGWKSTLVYQLDLVKYGVEYRLYYNAREGTSEGTEQIGCSVIKDNTVEIRKLWDLSV